MTDKITIERAKVERAVTALVYHQQQTRPIERTQIAIRELRAALAQQAVPQEPTKRCAHKTNGVCGKDGPCLSPYCEKLAAAKPTTAVPLTDEQIRMLHEALKLALRLNVMMTADEINQCRAALKATK